MLPITGRHPERVMPRAIIRTTRASRAPVKPHPANPLQKSLHRKNLHPARPAERKPITVKISTRPPDLMNLKDRLPCRGVFILFKKTSPFPRTGLEYIKEPITNGGVIRRIRLVHTASFRFFGRARRLFVFHHTFQFCEMQKLLTQ